MYKDGQEMGLKGYDIYPHDNPQNLTMNELEDRISRLTNENDTRDISFRGGAWSGD